jgi:hypothetical protein
MALFRRIKQAFDPRDLLNPGVIVPDGTPAVHDLKVGTGAAPIASRIETGLRELEQSAGWATPKNELASS